MSDTVFKTDQNIDHCFVCNKKNLKNKKECNFVGEAIEIIGLCFNIQFPDSCKDRILCESCVQNLENSWTFRKQVETAYEYLINNIKIYETYKPNVSSFDNNSSIFYEDNDKAADNVDESLNFTKVNSDEYAFAENNISKYTIKNQISSAESANSPKTKFWYTSNDATKNNEIFTSKTVIRLKSEEYQSDDEMSVTSLEMDIATGRNREIQNNPSRFLPVLNPQSKECPLCSNLFLSFTALLIHFEKHFPEVLCDLCGQGFKKMKSLNDHMNKHLKIQFKCEQCDKLYYAREALKHHIRIRHEGIHEYPCNLCKERFRGIVMKKKHLFECHGVESEMYPCSRCDKRFYSPYEMDYHLKKTHLKLRPHFCPECNMNFYSQRDLKNHMSIHTDIQRFTCEVCCKTLQNKKSFTKHLKIHRGDVKKLQCNICEKTFVQKFAFKSHVAKSHAEND